MFLLRLLNVHLVCIVFVYLFKGIFCLYSFTTLFTRRVIYRPSCQRSQTGLWYFSVRCTRQFKGSDQEIDCGSEGGMREKHELGRNKLVDFKASNKLVPPHPATWTNLCLTYSYEYYVVHVGLIWYKCTVSAWHYGTYVLVLTRYGVQKPGKHSSNWVQALNSTAGL